MVIGEVDRAVAHVVELLHLSQNVLGGPKAPFAVGQGGDVAIDARVGAAARGLHRAEFLQRQYRRNIQRQGFDVVDRQRGSVRIRKLIEIANNRAAGIPDDFFAVAPDQTGDSGQSVEVSQVIGQQFFTFTDAHGVKIRTVP